MVISQMGLAKAEQYHTTTVPKGCFVIIETDKIKEDFVKKNLLQEAQLMRRQRNPDIIRLCETVKNDNLYCLLTEIAETVLPFILKGF